MSNSDRLLISKLARKSKAGIITVADAAQALGLDRRSTALKLGSLTRKGWLLRARQGIYSILPLEAEPGKLTTPHDPWLLAQEAFSPCYIGGWSAAEYWGLTEQIFRSIFVITAAPVRSKSIKLLGQEFRLFRVPKTRVAIDTTVWRGSAKVKVSSRERTIVDCLRNTELSGGIRHLVPMMQEYASIPEHDFSKLLKEASSANSGAVWKRLGYLTELLWPEQVEIINEAARNLSTGTIKLDPLVRTHGKLLKRWRLWINVDVMRHD